MVAASAPAAAPTTYPGARHRKLSRHTCTIDCGAAAALAAGTSAVPQTKCAAAAPRSGPARSTNGSAAHGGIPPSQEYTAPVTLIVMTCDAMLNSVRWVERDVTLNVHWLHAPAAATIIV